MKSTTEGHQLGQLRARIEARFSDPALIVITSAGRGDGKTVTAFGVAEALAEGGRRVLLVDGNVDAPTLPRLHSVPSLGSQPDYSNISRFAKPVVGRRFFGISFADERLQRAMTMEQVRAAALDMRSHFDFVIFDASPLLESDLAVLFSAISDGTLLTLRFGRFPSGADEETIKTLTRVDAPMLGVLTVTQAMIKAFATRTKEVPQVLAPARLSTSRHAMEAETAREIAEPSPSNAVS